LKIITKQFERERNPVMDQNAERIAEESILTDLLTLKLPQSPFLQSLVETYS